MVKKSERGKGSKSRLRDFFVGNVGRILNSDELRQIAESSEWGRRVRELRNEEGWNIITHNDRSDLRPGEYLLVSLERIAANERGISKETRAYVLDRDGYTCQMCGIAAGELHPADGGRKARLHIGHTVDKSMGGNDEPNNLQAICSVCNEGASNLTLNRPQAIKLLAQIRRAPKNDQLDVLKWMVRKFPVEAHKLLETSDL